MGFMFGCLSLSVHAFDHDHSALTKVLQQYVKQVGTTQSTAVQYAQLKKNRTGFDAYIKQLEQLNKAEFEGFTVKQKLAFWINVYNAYTLQLIIDNYPVKSIKEIKGGGLLSVFSSPWKIEFIPLFGKKIHLDEVEHEIIRKQFDEPRIHFAVNCASISCPSLMNEAFTAKQLDQQLDKMAKNFITNSLKNKVDSKKKTLSISKIFDWYGGDFDKKHGGPVQYIAKIITDDPTIQKDIRSGQYDLNYLDYDWNLNKID